MGNNLPDGVTAQDIDEHFEPPARIRVGGYALVPISVEVPEGMSEREKRQRMRDRATDEYGEEPLEVEIEFEEGL